MANPILLCNNVTATYAIITSDQLGEKYESQTNGTIVSGSTRPIYKSFDVENGGNNSVADFDNLYKLCTGTNTFDPNGSVLSNGMQKTNITVGFNDSYAAIGSNGSVSQEISTTYPILDRENGQLTGFPKIGNNEPYEIKFKSSEKYEGDLYFAITCEMGFNMSNLNSTIGSSKTNKVYAYFAEYGAGNTISVKNAAADNAPFVSDDVIQRIYLNSERYSIQGLVQKSGTQNNSGIRLRVVNKPGETWTPSNETWYDLKIGQNLSIQDTYISGKCVAIYYKNAVSKIRAANIDNITGKVQAILIYKIGEYDILPAAIKQTSSFIIPNLHILNAHLSSTNIKSISLDLKYNFYNDLDASVSKYNASGTNALSYSIASRINLVGTLGAQYNSTRKSGSGNNITLYGANEIFQSSNISRTQDTMYLSFYNPGQSMINFNFGQLKTDHNITARILSINGNSTTKPFYYIGKSETIDSSENNDFRPESPIHKIYAGNTHNVNFYFYGMLPNSKTSGPDPAEINFQIDIPPRSYHNYIIYTHNWADYNESDPDDVRTSTILDIVNKLRPIIDTDGSKYFRMPILINEDTREVMADTTMLGAICPVIQKSESVSSGSVIRFQNIELENPSAASGGNVPIWYGSTEYGNVPIGWRFPGLGKLSLQKSDIDGFFGYRDDPEERNSSEKNKNKDVSIKGYTVTYGPIIFEPIISATSAEKLEYTHNYVFNFHFLYFDYKGNKNPRNTDGRRSFRALKLNEFDYLDCGDYQFNSATTPEAYNGLRDNLLMTSYSLLCTRTRSTESKSAAGPYSLFYGMLSQDDDKEVLQLERNNIHPAYVPGSYGNEQPGPGDKIKGAPSLSCKLNGNIGVAYKNNVWPFELEFNQAGTPISVANNTVLRNESNVGFDTLANKNSTGNLLKIPLEQRTYINSVSNDTTNP